MKKHLFTCFLALLCLFGSQISAQSKVAESPGACLLHRFAGPTVSPHSGDTHRGGAILSDTFLKITAHEIDGGPMAIRPRNSTIAAESTSDDVFQLQLLHGCGPSTVDCGPFGETATSPKKAPRSDVSEALEIGHRTSDIRNPKSGFSLVDDSISQGQEVDYPSAQVRDWEGDDQFPVFVYGEIRAGVLPDSVSLTFWEKYLGRYVSYVGMESRYVPLVSGSILQGASGKKVLKFESEPISESGYISITSVSGDQYLDRFLVEPGDSLIFGLDLKLGQLVFSGPDALKFELQHRLALAEAGVMFLETPSFHLQKGQDPVSQRESFMASSPMVSGYDPREMAFISYGEMRRNWMASRLEKLPQSDSRLSILEEYRGRISDAFIDILRADILGENAAKAISLIKNLPLESNAESQELFGDYLDRIGDLEVSSEAIEASAFYQEYLLERESLLAVYEGEGLFSRFEAQFSGPVYDRLVGRFLFENYYRLPDFGKAVDRVSETVSDPDILAGLQALASAHQTGSPIKELPLMDLQGQSTDLEAYRGKTVLLAFWFPGCLPSKIMHERQLSKVQEEFSDREDFVLISINTDPDPELWKTYLSENPSYSFGNEHLFLGGRDVHPFLKYYDIQAYPSLMLVDDDGRLIRSLKMPSRAADLIELISENLPRIERPNPNTKSK